MFGIGGCEEVTSSIFLAQKYEKVACNYVYDLS